jgi:hypothetical protein
MTLEEAMAKEKGTLSQLVLRYTSVMKQLLDQAKDNPGFTTKSWAPLAEMVDVDNFERIGTWKEVVNWQQYEKLLRNGPSFPTGTCASGGSRKSLVTCSWSLPNLVAIKA